MDITEQIKGKIAYVKANYAKPSAATLNITKNGPYDVKNYGAVNVAVEGGSWGGTNDVTIRFREQYWGYDDNGDTAIVEGDCYVNGYYTINNGSPIYFTDTNELVLNDAVGVGDNSEVYLQFYDSGYEYLSWASSASANGCSANAELDSYNEYAHIYRLNSFVGDATVTIVMSDM